MENYYNIASLRNEVQDYEKYNEKREFAEKELLEAKEDPKCRILFEQIQNLEEKFFNAGVILKHLELENPSSLRLYRWYYGTRHEFKQYAFDGWNIGSSPRNLDNPPIGRFLPNSEKTLGSARFIEGGNEEDAKILADWEMFVKEANDSRPEDARLYYKLHLWIVKNPISLEVLDLNNKPNKPEVIKNLIKNHDNIFVLAIGADV